MAANVISEARRAIATGDCMAAVHIMETQDMNSPEVLSVMGEAFFYMGRFEEAYRTYYKLFHDSNVKADQIEGSIEEYDPTGKSILESLTKLGIPQIMDMLPKTMDFEYKQSKETPRESYDEVLVFKEFMNHYIQEAGDDAQKANHLISKEIEKCIQAKSKVIQARGWFYRAEIYYKEENYMEAYKCYLKAATTEVSKAMYYGFAANMLLRMEKSNPGLLGVASVLNYRAIELDFENAKWHYNEGLYLTSLATLFGTEGHANQTMLRAARKQYATAYQVARDDQVQLKATMEQAYDVLRQLVG